MGYGPWGCKDSDMTEQLTHTLHCLQPSPPSPDETLCCKQFLVESLVFITFIYPKPYIMFALSDYSVNTCSLPSSFRRIQQVSFGSVSSFRLWWPSTDPCMDTHVFQCCPLLPAHACQPSFNLLPSSSLHTQRSTHSTGSGLSSQGSVIIGRLDSCC